MKQLTRTAVIAFSLMAGSVAAFAQSEPATHAEGAAALSKKELRHANWQTERAVRKALSSNRELDSSGILVVARGDNITLDGSVPSSNQIGVAQRAARGAAGGKNIVNNLVLREEGN